MITLFYESEKSKSDKMSDYTGF